MKITKQMIEEAMPEVVDLPPISDKRALQAARLLTGVFTASAESQAS